MDDQTTTEEVVADAGAEKALPEESQTETAEETASETATAEETSTGEEEASVPETDEKLQKYAKSHGIELDSPSAIKAAQIAMDNQAEYSRTKQQKSELEKTIDKGITEEAEARGLSDDDRVDIARIKAKLTVREFFDATPDAKPYEKQMIELLGSNPHLAGDLEGLYAKALLKSGNVESLKSEGGRKALESLASKQRATAPTGSAVNSSTSTQSITRAEINRRLQSGDTDWYAKNQAKINQLVAEGKLQ